MPGVDLPDDPAQAHQHAPRVPDVANQLLWAHSLGSGGETLGELVGDLAGEIGRDRRGDRLR